MQIAFIDLRRLNERFDIANAVSAVLQSGTYLHGVEVDSFEKEFARYTGTDHCVAVANGLDALRLTLRAWISLGLIANGDEVLVPANSFVASALAVTECGLRVRFADVSPITSNVTVGTVEKALTQRTRVVMPVHLYGQIADIERIKNLCVTRNLLLLEDAAQAHGARISSNHAGSFGNAGAYSFYPTKNLGALGDAGCVVTNDESLAMRVRSIANYGSSRKYWHDHLGTNSRMDEMQAAVLRLKLRNLDDDNARRREIAQRYRERIKNARVTLPSPPQHAESHVWHIFALAVPAREDLMRYFHSRGIQTNIHYPCVIHQQPAYDGYRDVRAPIAERLQHETLSLPISPVMENAQVDYVTEAINEWQAAAIVSKSGT
jgi:dTDP-4-amino-4,6-dideoxygalactose transaminase